MKKFLLALFLTVSSFVGIFGQESWKDEDFDPVAMAELFNMFGRYSEGLESALSALDHNPQEVRAYMAAGEALGNLDRQREALAMYEKAAEISKKDKKVQAECYVEISKLYAETGDTVKALEAVKKGLRADKKDGSLLLEKACLIFNSNRKDALKAIKDAKKFNPDNATLYSKIALLFLDNHILPEALENINEAISRNDSTGHFYVIRGLIKSETSERKAGIKDLVKAISVDNGYNRHAVRLLETYEEPADRNLIISEIEAIRDNDLSGRIYELEAGLLYSWGLFPSAAGVYSEIIDKGLDKPNTYFWLAKSQEMDGTSLKPYSTLKKGLEKYPKDTELRRYMAETYAKLGKFDEALALLEALTEEDPGDERSRLLQGEVLMDAGRYEESVRTLESLLADVDVPDVRIPLQMAYFMSGNSTGLSVNSRGLLDYNAEALINAGYWPDYIYALGNAGLNRESEVKYLLDKIDSDNGTSSCMIRAITSLLMGKKKEALEAVRSGMEEGNLPLSTLVYGYHLYPLHPEKEYEELLDNAGILVERNPETGLLRLMYPEVDYSSGGVTWADLQKLNARDWKEWERQVNRICPIDLGSGGQVVSVKADEKNNKLTFNCIVTPEQMDLKMMASNPELEKKHTDIYGLDLIRSNPDMVSYPMNIEWNYSYQGGKDKVSRLLSAARIKELGKMAMSGEAIDDLIIDTAIEEEKVDESGMLIDVFRNDTDVVQVIRSNDEYVTELELFPDQIKSSMTGLFKDPSSRRYVGACIRRGLGFKYVYRNPQTGKEGVVRFSPEEVRKIIDFQP